MDIFARGHTDMYQILDAICVTSQMVALLSTEQIVGVTIVKRTSQCCNHHDSSICATLYLKV